MKTITKMLVLSLSILALAVPVAGAQTAPQPTTVEPENAQAQEGEQAARQQRLKERKERLDVRLNEAQTRRLQARCKNAQGKISSLSKRVHGLQTSREQKYTNLTNRLNTLVQQLEARQIDTAGLQEHTVKLVQLIEGYELAMQTHLTALDDLAAMDCEADPEAFQATLNEARTSLSEVKEGAVAIKAFLQDELKAELVTLKKSFAENKTTEKKPVEEDDGSVSNEPPPDDPNTPVSSEEQQ